MKQSKKLFVILSLLLLNSGDSRYVFRIDKQEVIGNVEYLNASSDIVYNENGKNLVSINVSTIKILRGLKFITSMTVSMGKNLPSSVVYNHTVDLCRYIKRKNGSDKIFQFMYNAAQKYGKLPDRCPLPIGYYYIKDYYIEETIFPPFVTLPETTAFLKTDFFIDKGIKVLEADWWCQIRRK